MSDEGSLYHWLVTGVIGVGGTVISWLVNRNVQQQDDVLKEYGETLKDHSKQHAACHLELANFKTEVAKDYAKDANIQQTLARVHERIDQVGERVDEGFKELRGDIKQILQKVK